MRSVVVFFFNDTATTEIYTLSLHDALPIWRDSRGAAKATGGACASAPASSARRALRDRRRPAPGSRRLARRGNRSEEHTSELQSRQYLVCRLLLEKKKKKLERQKNCQLGRD